VAIARRCVAGRVELFERLLDQFLAAGSDGPAPDVVRLVADGQYAQAAQHAHSLRGSTGLVGALPLARLAELFESLVRDQAAPAEIERAALALHDEHLRVLSAVAAWRRARPAADRSLPRPTPEDLDRLERKLEAADYNAVRLHRALAPALRVHAPAEAEALDRAIGRFDHATALAALRALRSILPN
jgi:two-component system sensor histidine kinase/response regulator